MREFFGDNALAAIGVDLVARYQDAHLGTASQRKSRFTGSFTLLRRSTVRLDVCDRASE